MSDWNQIIFAFKDLGLWLIVALLYSNAIEPMTDGFVSAMPDERSRELLRDGITMMDSVDTAEDLRDFTKKIANLLLVLAPVGIVVRRGYKMFTGDGS